MPRSSLSRDVIPHEMGTDGGPVIVAGKNSADLPHLAKGMTMKAAVYRSFGGPEVLEVVEVPEPKMFPDQVRIRIKAAALNPADLGFQAGAVDALVDSFFPVIPGWDVAGIVEEAGIGTTGFKPGDEVIGFVRGAIQRYGSYAEQIAAEPRQLARKPANLDWGQAAGLPLAGLTAHQAVVDALDVRAGETVLVHGASGGVGHLAVQLAAARGASVVGTASESNHDYLRSLGVQPVAYGDGLADRVRALAPGGVDAVLDTSGQGALAITHRHRRRASRLRRHLQRTPRTARGLRPPGPSRPGSPRRAGRSREAVGPGSAVLSPGPGGRRPAATRRGTRRRQDRAHGRLSVTTAGVAFRVPFPKGVCPDPYQRSCGKGLAGADRLRQLPHLASGPEPGVFRRSPRRRHPAPRTVLRRAAGSVHHRASPGTEPPGLDRRRPRGGGRPPFLPTRTARRRRHRVHRVRGVHRPGGTRGHRRTAARAARGLRGLRRGLQEARRSG